MRVTGFGSSLLGYMNATSSSNSLLSSIYGARRTSSFNPVRSTANYNSYSSILSKYGSNLSKYSNITSYYEKNAYSQIKTGAVGLRSHGEVLNETGEDSLFGKAEATGKTEDVVAEINNFVKDYNSMLSNMKKVGGSVNNIYGRQFSTQTLIHKNELSKIGITAASDGTLQVNQKTLESAGLDDMKKVFQGTSSFAGQASMKSIYVESNAVSNISASSYSSYGNYGNYNNYGSYGYGNYSYGAYSPNSYGSLFNSYF